MRFLADENVDIAVIRALRAAGYDVAAMAQEQPGASDQKVVGKAITEARNLITEDRDFGRLVYVQLLEAQGVIYLRYPIGARTQIAAELVGFLESRGDAVPGSFVVIQPGRTRIARLPRS